MIELADSVSTTPSSFKNEVHNYIIIMYIFVKMVVSP